MYQEFFRLHESPFSLDPDPRFLYLSPAHTTARAYLDYTVESRDGMVVLTGHAGCGKSILVADLCRRVDHADIVLLDQTQLDSQELLQTLLIALGDESSGSRPQLHARLRQILCERLDQGRRMTLIVDEAQHLGWEALETLRMVADQQHRGRRLLAVILVGQLGLARTLKSQGLEQFRQRVRLFYTLEPLARPEIRRYIEHRLRIAGGHHDVIVSPRALQIIKRYTGGVPRLINTLMDMALTAAALEGTRMISARLVQESARELQWTPYFLRHGRLVLGDHLRDLGDSVEHLSATLKPRVAKLQGALGTWVGAWGLKARRTLARVPTQVMAGLGGAALVLIPMALWLPSALQESHRTEPQPIPAVASVPPAPEPAIVQRLATIKADAIRPARSAWRPSAPATSAPATASVSREPKPPATAPAIVEPVTPRSPSPAEALRPALPGALRDAHWLLQQPAEAYSVQLFAANSPAGVQRFLDEHGNSFRGDRELAAFIADREGSPWHVLVMATYPTYSATRAAIEGLPASLRKHQPWVRRIHVIHEAIHRATPGMGTRDDSTQLVAGRAEDIAPP